jgi:hypothetical protein
MRAEEIIWLHFRGKRIESVCQLARRAIAVTWRGYIDPAGGFSEATPSG